MKRMMSLLLCALLMLSCAKGEGWMSGMDEDGAVDVMNENVVYDSADSVGTVVNGGVTQATEEQKIVYSFTPVDVVLVLDISGSMAVANPANGKSLLDYASDAADVFARTLYSVNPASRIGVVIFDDVARPVSAMKGISEQQELLNVIHSMYYGGNTNTGGGFQEAASLLGAQAMDGRRCMVLMITDGLANVGGSNPQQYAVSQGQAVRRLGNVYTIGLVGGMGASEKRYTRQVLSAGYETRYFEVDFDSVGDMGTALANIMTTLPVVVSASEMLEDGGSIQSLSTYNLSVGSGFKATVSSGNETLSSASGSENSMTSFGSLSVVDGKQTFVMLEGDYDIDIKGVGNAKGGYTLSEVTGLSIQEKTIKQDYAWSDPSIHTAIHIRNGQTTVEQLGYNPIDVTDTDEEGKPVTGTQEAGGAVVNGIITVYSAPDKNAQSIGKVPKNGRVRVLAHDTEKGYSFVSTTDDKGLVRRGWMKTTALKELQGFVPEMPWLSGSFTVKNDTASYYAPDERAASAYKVKAGTVVELKHTDRDVFGNEWAYVALPGKDKSVRYVYILAETLAEWQTLADENFRIGRMDPVIDTEIAFPPMLDVIREQKLAVYSGPDRSYWRGAKGKALVNTNGGLYAAGWVDHDWLLVQYGTTIGNRRTGYVYAESIQDHFSLLPQLNFAAVPATITTACVLTDDPENYSEEIVSLAPGTVVTYLAEYAGYKGGQPFYYIETKAAGKRVRGFVPVECLEK